MSDNYQGPGVYRHYKGGEYVVLGLALHEHGKDHNANWNPHDDKFQQVIYRARSYAKGAKGIMGSPATMWIRRLCDFNEHIDISVGGALKTVPRFEKIGELNAASSE